MMERRRRRQKGGGKRTRWAKPVLLLLVALGAGGGCMNLEVSSSGYNGLPVFAGEQSSLHLQAEHHLATHHVEEAQATYHDILRADPDDGRARVGKAITDLLLLPGSEPVRQLLSRGLAAERAERFNLGQLLYAEEAGLLSLMSRGVPWESEERFEGARAIVSDHLPWEPARLDSLEAFVAELKRPLDELMIEAVAVAEALGSIQEDLHYALWDPDFTHYLLPGEVFHDRLLTLSLGRSEVSALQGLVSLTRGAIYLAAAYRWDFSLEEALGARWQEIADDPSHPEHVPGWGPEDYTSKFLSTRLLREIRDPALLPRAQEMLGAAAMTLTEAVTLGLDSPRDFTLEWSRLNRLDRRHLENLRDALAAVRDALYGPTVIPNTEPRTTLDLSPLFEDGGRTLPEGVPLLVEHIEVDDFDNTTIYRSWRTNQEAIDALTEGLVEPPSNDEESLRLTVDEQTIENIADVVTSGWRSDLKSSYLY